MEPETENMSNEIGMGDSGNDNESDYDENDDDDEFRGKGGRSRNFRGRNWSGRFRGRGYGPSGPPFRGGRGGTSFNRVGRAGNGMAGFNGGPPNFAGMNWGGPPGMMGPPPGMGMNGPPPFGPPGFGPPGMCPPGMMGGPMPYGNNMGAPYMSGLDMDNDIIWVETKTGDGKSYYYNAKTRETSWNPPAEGPNTKVITQEQVEAIAQATAAAKAVAAAAAVGAIPMQAFDKNDEKMDSKMDAMDDLVAPGTDPVVDKQFNAPFGLPPPNWMTQGQMQPWATPGLVPPGLSNQMPNSYGDFGVNEEAQIMSQIDSNIIAKAQEWSEHRAPDGRPYYYNSIKGESVWEKPQALKDLEAAKLAVVQGVITKPAVESEQHKSEIVNEKTPTKATETPKEELVEVKEEPKKEEPKKEENDIKVNKEDDKQETSKSQDKSRPISSTPVPGTPWCVVWTGDGRVFFYNPSTRTSVWERPDDLLSRPDVDKMISNPPEILLSINDGPNKQQQNVTPQKQKKRSNSIDNENEISDIVKKQKTENINNAVSTMKSTSTNEIENSASLNSSTLSGTNLIKAGKEAAIEAEVRAAKERAIVPLEIRIKSFKEMLAEKDVSAFSTWEKELHKIVFDSRYLLLTSKERKQVFEKYVKERAEDERREKRNKLRERKDQFRKLLQEAHLHGKSSFGDFAQKYGKDERFKNIEKMREREGLFNEYLIEVRKKEKEEKNQKREQTKKDFFTMLREHSDIDRHSRWYDVKKKLDSSDSRYRAVESSSMREDWFRDYCKLLKDEKRRAKEKDKENKKDKKKEKRDKDEENESSHKKHKKDKDEKENNATDKEEDEKNIDSDKNEEGEDDEDDDKERKEKEKQARTEASLRAREKEVHRTLAGHLRERDKEREQHKHDEAVQLFNALLADLVRNSELTWREAKRQLRKDSRWSMLDSSETQLSRDEKEKLFNEHVNQLISKKREKFRDMLNELSELTLVSQWRDVKKLIRDDPRYSKFSSSSEKCEREFKDYIKDKTMKTKTEFYELLEETPLLTHKSLSQLKENESQYMKEIESILKNDKRFLVLDCIADERKDLIIKYLEELDKRGPPPPPTATEPNRRLNK